MKLVGLFIMYAWFSFATVMVANVFYRSETITLEQYQKVIKVNPLVDMYLGIKEYGWSWFSVDPYTSDERAIEKINNVDEIVANKYMNETTYIEDGVIYERLEERKNKLRRDRKIPGKKLRQ